MTSKKTDLYDLIDGRKYKKCKEHQIRNPETKRCINKPKELKPKECPEGKILNPKTNKCVSITGKIGQQLISTKVPVKVSSSALKPINIMLNKFKHFFKDDLIGFFDNKPLKFIIATAGGYGIKTLLEKKYNIYGKVLTTDLDLTVSIHNCTMSSYECFKYFERKLELFFNQQENPNDFQFKYVNLNHMYVPVMNYYRDYLMMIKYKNSDFIDIAITNQHITIDKLDKQTSIKAGIPLKTEEYYLIELLSLIYMETVKGASKYCYTYRNPITGVQSCKGIKDIHRIQLLCTLKHKKRYKQYCELIENTTIDKLKAMPVEKRDAYFSILKKILFSK